MCDVAIVCCASHAAAAVQVYENQILFIFTAVQAAWYVYHACLFDHECWSICVALYTSVDGILLSTKFSALRFAT